MDRLTLYSSETGNCLELVSRDLMKSWDSSPDTREHLLVSCRKPSRLWQVWHNSSTREHCSPALTLSTVSWQVFTRCSLASSVATNIPSEDNFPTNHVIVTYPWWVTWWCVWAWWAEVREDNWERLLIGHVQLMAADAEVKVNADNAKTVRRVGGVDGQQHITIELSESVLHLTVCNGINKQGVTTPTS